LSYMVEAMFDSFSSHSII